MGCVYLLHFDTVIGNERHTAQHYIGYADKSLRERIATHRSGRGARITQVLHELGIGFTVVKVWRPGTRKLEKQLKRQKHAWRHCPICRQARKDEDHGRVNE